MPKRVQNVIGSSKGKVPKDILKCWENYTGITQIACSVIDGDNCKGQQLNGAHVIYIDEDVNKQYIIPLCDSCNGKSPDDVLNIYDDIKRMEADKLKHYL